MLYLGEINSSQAWRKSIEVFDEDAEQSRSLSLFPEDRIDEALADESVVRLCLSRLRLELPAQPPPKITAAQVEGVTPV
ncbi:MAG: hypothetical protein GY815_06475 [Gammaproteobacteria bacterium]|nr:hypothetical protein [Gammaproteobacteria bacterium]